MSLRERLNVVAALVFTLAASACATRTRVLTPTPAGKVAPYESAGEVKDPSRTYTTTEQIKPTSPAAPRPAPKVGTVEHETSSASVGFPPPSPPRSPDQATGSVQAVKYARKHAVVIGISEYSQIQPLEGARGDAEAVAQRLRAASFDDVTELYDGAATRRAILTQLGTELPKSAGKDDLVVIFFAGHGQTETLPNGEKRGYIVPADGDSADVFSTSISMEEMRELSNRIQAKHIYYAMDSCYSGTGFARAVGPMKTDGYRFTTASERTVQMITAGTDGQQARERGGRGLFTTYLLRAIDGAADANADHTLTASEIGGFVAEQVKSASKSRQTPMYGTIEGRGEVTLPVSR